MPLFTWYAPAIPVLSKTFPLKLRKSLRRVKDTPLSTAKTMAILAVPVWLISLLWTWSWWFSDGRADLLWLYIPLSAALFYEFVLLPSALLFFVLLAKNPPKRRALQGAKVALITLCVPAQESIKVIERQLEAMSEVTYPHDSWILDEGNSQKLKKLARKYGIKHFSRRNVAKYNQETYPYKVKTKAGNVNAWLDYVKRRKYEYFVQLDIDHAPKPNYLDKTLPFFRDKKVAWIQSPAVYVNTDNWIARGAAEQDFAYHGPVQMGFYGLSETPMVVGSHCAYRGSAINEIGGFQPTRAEDHLDTVAMASRGWKGVFVPEVIAQGYGPETFGAYLTQQFAWAYSMFQVVMKFSPKYLIKIRNPKKLIPILFCETFYPLWALTNAITFSVPAIALILNRDIVNMKWSDFPTRILPTLLALLIVWFSARPLMHSGGQRISWRGGLLEIIRWPALLLAVISALLHVKKPYMVTPKGQSIGSAPSARVYFPFVLLGLLSAAVLASASLIYGSQISSGQLIFVLANIALMTIICLLDLNTRLRSIKKIKASLSLSWLKPTAAVMALLIIFSTSLVATPAVQKSMVLALSRSIPPVPELDPSIKPASQLTHQELLQQIAKPPVAGDTSNLSIGIYDPDRNYASATPYIRHYFMDWRHPRQLGEEILKSQRLGAVPLITIEPAGYKDGKALLQGIANGEFDDRLSALAEVLSNTNQPVYIRFAHEMDLPEAYPWSTKDPKLYVAAYRHTVMHMRANGVLDNVKWMWSPGGVRGTAEYYYPGDDVTDVIGSTVLYDRYWNGNFHPTFAQLVEVRLWLEKYGWGKPVWIAEFGAGNADPVFQAKLLKEAATRHKEYGFSALVYINIVEPSIESGPDYTLKDPDLVKSALGIKPRQTRTSISDNSKQIHEHKKEDVKIKETAKQLETPKNYHKLSLDQMSLGPVSGVTTLDHSYKNTAYESKHPTLFDYLQDFLRKVSTYQSSPIQEDPLTQAFKDIESF